MRNRRWLSVLCVLAFVATTLPAGAGTQRSYSGLLALDGGSGEELFRKDPPNGLTYWDVVVARRLVVATEAECNDNAGLPGLVAVDRESGETQWRARGAGPATHTMAGTEASVVPVAAAGVVVTPGGRFGSEVRGLDARDGSVRWNMPTNQLQLGVSRTQAFSAAPAGQRLPGEERELVAADRRTGLEQWRFPAIRDPAWGPTFDVVATDDERVVVANGDYFTRIGDNPGGPTTMFVLDSDTGFELSRFVVPDPIFFESAFRIVGDTLLLGEDRSRVAARSLVDGRVLWERRFAEPSDGVAMFSSASPSIVFATDRRTTIDALDAQSGALRWRVPGTFSIASGTDVTVLVDGLADLTAVDTVTGRTRWRRPLPARFDRARKLDVQISSDRILVAALCATE